MKILKIQTIDNFLQNYVSKKIKNFGKGDSDKKFIKILKTKSFGKYLHKSIFMMEQNMEIINKNTKIKKYNKPYPYIVYENFFAKDFYRNNRKKIFKFRGF